MTKSYTSPFVSEDIGEHHPEYWLGRRKIAGAVRDLVEASTTSDIPPDVAQSLAASIETIAAKLREHRQLPGVIAHAKALGSYPVANHEMLSVGGASHPMAPGLRFWDDGDQVRGTVTFDWAYEGPPNHVHGGWVAAILDHFMGMAQIRAGAPGMTGGLDVRYLRPTPIGVELRFIARLDGVEGRSLFVSADVEANGVRTAEASGLFTAVGDAHFEAFAKRRSRREEG